jgi:glutamyl-tRNA synthetase
MHLPLITGKDGKKLSKRDPTAPIKHIIDKGYQKEAINNFVGLLGFTPPNEEKSGNKISS